MSRRAWAICWEKTKRCVKCRWQADAWDWVAERSLPLLWSVEPVARGSGVGGSTNTACQHDPGVCLATPIFLALSSECARRPHWPHSQHAMRLLFLGGVCCGPGSPGPTTGRPTWVPGLVWPLAGRRGGGTPSGTAQVPASDKGISMQSPRSCMHSAPFRASASARRGRLGAPGPVRRRGAAQLCTASFLRCSVNTERDTSSVMMTSLDRAEVDW